VTSDNDKLKIDVDWQGIERYISELNNENKYNSNYKNMKFKLINIYLVKYKNMDTLLFVYESKD
jgi:hypothetical protein